MSNDLTERRKIILGVTGSIAAYKSAELARLLVSWGHEVRVVMTDAAREFIAPLTFQAITNNSVVLDFWEGDSTDIGHIELADWADIVLIAPATADFIAKLAHGFADNPLSALCLATRAPILLAPAMNVNMFEHPQTMENVATLRKRGVHFVDPEEGALACGWNGTGRLADPMEIFYHARRRLSRNDYKGKKVLIVTGPTREPIDPVRFLSNRSSGKMGVALAREAFRRGAEEIALIHGPVKVKVPGPVQCKEVSTALQMRDAVVKYFKEGTLTGERSRAPDVVIMAAAVSDFRPSQVAQEKIKKGDHPSSIALTINPDILQELGDLKGEQDRPVLVGFAVETGEIEHLIEEARGKLERKNLNIIVGNFADDALGLDTNRAWIIDKNGKQEEVATAYKSRVANKILDAVLKQ